MEDEKFVNGVFFTRAQAKELWPLVRNYHYSACMPSAIRYSFAIRKPGGFWKYGLQPIAGLLYGNPANRNWPQNALELLRTVRYNGDLPVQLSQFIAWSIKWLKHNTNVPFIISYADYSGQGHHGGLYQACGFYYVGMRVESCPAFLLPDGSKKHSRQVNRELGSRSIPYVAKIKPDWQPITQQTKFLYLKPLHQKLEEICEQRGLQVQTPPKPDIYNHTLTKQS